MSVPVSVVVPCFRCAASIGRAIESVLRQTRPPAEIILVDDASDDGSREALARQPAGVRVIRLERNVGPASARNIGWNAATQDYIAFLDADDAWHPRKIEIQLDWMQRHPEVALTGHSIVEAPLSGEPGGEAEKSVRQVSGAMLLRSNRFHTSSVMLRRGIAQRFAEGKRYCEDYLLWLEVVLSGGEACHLDLPLGLRFKPVYGAAGASGRLWKMERGELDALRRVWRSGLLGYPECVAASAWSLLKFMRRLATAPRGR